MSSNKSRENKCTSSKYFGEKFDFVNVVLACNTHYLTMR
jgi:hypothetical protein